MQAARLLLVVAAAATLVCADIALVGPYAVDILELGPCDDGEYPGSSFNLSLVVDDETNDTAYSGDVTVTYDFLADDCEFQITIYRWGSTGGWGKIFYLNYTKPFDYTKANFPVLFENLFGKMGIKEKPVSPGTYYVDRLALRGFTLKKFPEMHYGKYKVYTKGLKDGAILSCIQTVNKVYEVPSSPGTGFKRPF